MTDKTNEPTAAASEERPPTTGSRRVDQILRDATCSRDCYGVPSWYVFLMEGDRYLFDVELASEWRQFDTDQDASYFGIWTCKQRLLILRYLDGDVYLDAPSTPEDYNQAIERMCDFYDPAPAFVTIGDSGISRYFEDRAEHLIAQHGERVSREES